VRAILTKALTILTMTKLSVYVLHLQSTIAKLMPTPEANMAVLCVLGPVAIIPFSIVRVGTGHLYLWAMGMISALYVGMPIIAGAMS
jgi:EamA domain-containing membrane protein RarD